MHRCPTIVLGSAVRGARIVTPRLALFSILWPTQRLSLFSHHGSRLAPSPLFWALLVPLIPLRPPRSFTALPPHAQVCPAAPPSLSRWSALGVVFFWGSQFRRRAWVRGSCASACAPCATYSGLGCGRSSPQRGIMITQRCGAAPLPHNRGNWADLSHGYPCLEPGICQ